MLNTIVYQLNFPFNTTINKVVSRLLMVIFHPFVKATGVKSGLMSGFTLINFGQMTN